MTPDQQYKNDLLKPGFHADDAQLRVVSHTQHLYEQLLNPPKPSFIDNLFGKQQPVHGLYLWGGTGRGKTYLVDSFYACLPFKQKYRTHFHSFMRDIHSRLQNLPKTPDPLKIIAADLAADMRILCLDEFHVHDIGDAMIMAGLLEAIFKQGITLVATSNIATDDLYKNGLQRELFMGTIDLLQQHTTEINLGHDNDYRLQILEQNATYNIIKQAGNNQIIQQQFDAIIPCLAKHNREIIVNQRPIHFVASADDVIWFDFNQLCNTPRSDSDYINIAENFHTLFISDVDYMDEEHDNIAKRFIHLIDALYDHHVKCIITAVDKPQKLYRGRVLRMAFERTISRLIEMDTQQYLAKEHLVDTAKSRHAT